jgi:hypothetical protein
MIPVNPHKKPEEFMPTDTPESIEEDSAYYTWEDCARAYRKWLKQYGCEYENEKGEHFYEIYIPLEVWKELEGVRN